MKVNTIQTTKNQPIQKEKTKRNPFPNHDNSSYVIAEAQQSQDSMAGGSNGGVDTPT